MTASIYGLAFAIAISFTRRVPSHCAARFPTGGCLESVRMAARLALPSLLSDVQSDAAFWGLIVLAFAWTLLPMFRYFTLIVLGPTCLVAWPAMLDPCLDLIGLVEKWNASVAVALLLLSVLLIFFLTIWSLSNLNQMRYLYKRKAREEGESPITMVQKSGRTWDWSALVRRRWGGALRVSLTDAALVSWWTVVGPPAIALGLARLLISVPHSPTGTAIEYLLVTAAIGPTFIMVVTGALGVAYGLTAAVGWAGPELLRRAGLVRKGSRLDRVLSDDGTETDSIRDYIARSLGPHSSWSRHPGYAFAALVFLAFSNSGLVILFVFRNVIGCILVVVASLLVLPMLVGVYELHVRLKVRRRASGFK